MSFVYRNTELRLPQNLINLLAGWDRMMDGRKGNSLVEGRSMDHRPLSQLSSRRSLTASYFSIESLLVLVCLTVSLLILPLILPPLPPPPFMLLLLPIAILALLIILAFMPSDVRDIASSYV